MQVMHPATALVLAMALLAGCQSASDHALASRSLHLDAPTHVADLSAHGCWSAPTTGGADILNVPCPSDLTVEFVSALQRALAVRGYMASHVTGDMDARTLGAIQAYQAVRGFDSTQLTLRTARELGLLPWDPADL